MQKCLRSLTATLFGLGSAIVIPGLAEAGSFALREQSTIGQGENFAGVAAGSAGLGSMYWNPATMTAGLGWQTQVNAAALFPYANVTPGAGTSPVLLGLGGTGSSGDAAINGLLPSGYVSYQFNDRVWLGVGLNSPFGVLAKDPTNFAGQIYGRTTTLRSYDFNPTVAFKVTDWLSVGAGIQAEYLQLRLSQATSPAPYAPSATIKGDSLGVGFTAGLTVTPRAGTEFGVGYRSSVAHSLDGSLQVDAMPAIPSHASMSLPDQITVGLSQAVTRDLTLDAGYEWTHWSRLGTVTLQNAVAPQALAFDYKDGSAVNVGGAYKWNDRVTLRSGVGYDWSPVTVANRDTRSPDGDHVSVSAGIGYKVTDTLSVDLAYSHYFLVGNTSVQIVPGNPHYLGLPLVATVSADADVGSVGLTYKW